MENTRDYENPVKTIISIIWKNPVGSLIVMGALFFILNRMITHSTSEDSTPVSVIGVHHLGGEYLINQFYINKSIGDGVDESGGGGSHRCCVNLPNKWGPTLYADVRWEVHKILRPLDSGLPETVANVAIYKAQVPIEKYNEPAAFWVHFFSDGRVRIVVTPFAPDGDNSPIRWGDKEASRLASRGKAVEALFTSEELADFVRQAESDIKNGGWR